MSRSTENIKVQSDGSIEEPQSSDRQSTSNDEETGSNVQPQPNSDKCENCPQKAASIGIQSNDSGIQRRTQLLCVRCATERYQKENLKDQKGVSYTCYGCNSSFETFHKARKKTRHENCRLKKPTECGSQSQTKETSNPVPHPSCQDVRSNKRTLSTKLDHDYH